MASSKPEDQKPAESFLGDLLAGKTPAVKNMEAAWTRAGAGNNHTPGHASKLGSQDQPDKNGSGIGSKAFQDTIGDQRPEVSAQSFVFLENMAVVHLLRVEYCAVGRGLC